MLARTVRTPVPPTDAAEAAAAAAARPLRRWSWRSLPGAGVAAIAVMTLVVVGFLAALGTGIWLGFGGYNVSTLPQHTPLVHGLLATAMERAVRWRARGIEPPAAILAAADDPAMTRRGALLYRDRCEQCHGGPAVAQAEIGRGMQPLPGPLIDLPQRWTLAEAYWITRHGIRMTGMPAWLYRLDDEELWAVTLFARRLALLTPADYRRLTNADGQAARTRQAPPTLDETRLPADLDRLAAAGDAERGRQALAQYACIACHVIPGITGSDVHVGPPLERMAMRGLIAGAVPNTQVQMIRWLIAPQAIDPDTAMPAMGVTPADAADLAAYLATLR